MMNGYDSVIASDHGNLRLSDGFGNHDLFIFLREKLKIGEKGGEMENGTQRRTKVDTQGP